MIAGLSGSMLSHDALRAHGYTDAVGEAGLAVRRFLSRWHAVIARTAGPTWTARKVFDEVAAPFCEAFGFQPVPTLAAQGHVRAQLVWGGAPVAVAVSCAWEQDLGAAWRESVRLGLAAGVRWCLCFNGPALRTVDATRTHSRRYFELDLARVATDSEAFALAWRLLHASGFRAGGDALHRAVALSERHRVDVRESLQAGVHEALTSLTRAFVTARTPRRRARINAAAAFDESLIVVYRVLFLLFAEARSLVPTWHPIFRDSYTIESLRGEIESRGRTAGIWAALQAIARLAHRGCRAGALRVPPFNGRLFSPTDAPFADLLPLDESLVRDALAALTIRRGPAGLQRISYGDLGVEHLGGVYERVLDFDMAATPAGARLVRGDKRKASGSFYTPRSLTEHLVRRTLAPLVEGAAPEAILRLRVVDPAMGSGAFLVAACRYLAHAYEAALVRTGAVIHADVADRERASFRRVVAQRCLYGVDVNPMAVQLARLSLWLATLSGDRPLTFFDHHLRAGNSLVGARIEDVRRGSTCRPHRTRRLPLLDDAALGHDLDRAVESHARLREQPEETLEQVRDKEALFAHLASADGPLARWKRVADLWCAGWFDSSVRRMGRGAFLALLESNGGTLPSPLSSALLDSAQDAARRERFFHWTLEFPEVFAGAAGTPGREGGFDAVIGNPPWDMLRTATGRALTHFSRESGSYHVQGSGHANLYQLFAERSLSLLRRGGRLGLVLPAGALIDHGCARLRRHLLDTTEIDSLTVVDNREALFPIHRGLKFALLTATTGSPTLALPLRCGLHAAEQFDRLPASGPDPQAVTLSRELLERASGEQLAVPDLPTSLDATLFGRLTLAHLPASDPRGWHLRFGRELNATDDRPSFTTAVPGSLPVVEGKQIQPFTVDVDASQHAIDPAVARRLLPSRGFEMPRLAYRDVAAATNRLTLIAAVVPSGVVTTHTLFCLKTPLEEDLQHVLCGLFNSYVANYLVRRRVSTHVTVAIVERLPLPAVARASPDFSAMLSLARRLAVIPADAHAAASLQGLAARLYGLTAAEFEHVLTTFPLVEREDRERALRFFVDRL